VIALGKYQGLRNVKRHRGGIFRHAPESDKKMPPMPHALGKDEVLTLKKFRA